MKSKLLKTFFVSILFICFLLISAKSYANTVFNELSNNIFRLHILANSDSSDDQELKLKVRDAIIEYMGDLTKDCKTKDDVILKVSNNIEKFYIIANEIIKENGYNYSVNINIRKLLFSNKILRKYLNASRLI